jgi:hypothetical protein
MWIISDGRWRFRNLLNLSRSRMSPIFPISGSPTSVLLAHKVNLQLVLVRNQSCLCSSDLNTSKATHPFKAGMPRHQDWTGWVRRRSIKCGIHRKTVVFRRKIQLLDGGEYVLLGGAIWSLILRKLCPC